MTNPIEAKLAELSPTYQPHIAQSHAIRTSEDPQAIADSIDAKMAAAQALADRHWGEGVAEIEDLMAAMSLYSTGTFDPEVAPVSILYGGLQDERIFELGKRAGAATRSEDDIILSDMSADILEREPDAEEVVVSLDEPAEGITNPIEAKLAELSPTYQPHSSQRYAIRTSEDPQAIADSIDAKMAAAQALADRHWGEGVAEIEDLMAAMSLYSTGTFYPALAPASVLYGGLDDQRIFELGKRAGAATRSEDDIILSALRAAASDSDQTIGDETDNTLTGGPGDDKFYGQAGADTIDGGDGIDTAFYSGSEESYTLNLTQNSITLSDRRTDGDDTDTLVNIEFLSFGVDLLSEPFDMGQLGGLSGLTEDGLESFIELYIAFFNRAPDAIGLNFWGTAFANGATLEQMASLFADQDETSAIYPDGSTNTEFALSVYNNVLGRTPDQSGIDFWVDVLDSGGLSRGQFILEVLRGAKSELKPEEGQAFVDQQLADRAYLENKVDIGAYFSVYRGMSDVENASAAMALFDGSQASVNQAVAAIDGYYEDALDPTNGEFLIQIVGVLDNPFPA